MSDRFKKLTATEQKIIETLTDGPKSVKDIADRVNVSASSVYRPVRELCDKGWLELDREATAFSRYKMFRIKRTPNSGIELIVNVHGEQQAVSFNLFLEKVAAGAEAGSVPKIARQWSTFQRAIAYLAIYAAEELETPGSVTEAQLLEIKSPLMHYADVLKEQFALVSQVLNNEAFWDAQSLKNGTMKKTDRHFTPDEMRKFAKIILSQFQRMEQESDETVTLEGEVLQ